MELLEIFLFIMFVFGCGYVVGKIHSYWVMSEFLARIQEKEGIDLVRMMKNLNDEDNEVVTEVSKPAVYKLEVETHGETLYLWDRENNSFVCQGKTLEELAKFAKDYKQIIYASVLYGEKVFMFNDGEHKEYTK